MRAGLGFVIEEHNIIVCWSGPSSQSSRPCETSPSSFFSNGLFAASADLSCVA